MSNLVKEKIIKIGEKSFTLKFNFLVMLNFKEVSGVNFFTFISSLNPKDKNDNPIERIDAKDLVALFQSFVIGGGTKISLQEAATLLTFESFNDFMAIIPELISSGLPENKLKDAPKEKDSPLA